MKGRNITLSLGLVLTALLLLLLVISLFYKPHEPTAIDPANRLAAPGLSHLFGTDHMGRDVFSRVLDGAGTTLFVALGTVAIGALGGAVTGAITGYFGGWLDEILMRLADVLTAFPAILLALVVISLTGPGTANVIVILGILFIPSFARVLRGEFLRCKNLDYVKRARLMGASSLRIMGVHILPNTLPVFLSAVAIGFNNAVLAEASMSYLGLGVQQPEVSLGRLLADSQAYLFNAPWIALSAGGTIVWMVLSFSLLADGLQQGERRGHFAFRTGFARHIS